MNDTVCNNSSRGKFITITIDEYNSMKTSIKVLGAYQEILSGIKPNSMHSGRHCSVDNCNAVNVFIKFKTR